VVRRHVLWVAARRADWLDTRPDCQPGPL